MMVSVWHDDPEKVVILEIAVIYAATLDLQIGIKVTYIRGLYVYALNFSHKWEKVQLASFKSYYSA